MDSRTREETIAYIESWIEGQGFEIVKLKMTPDRHVMLTVDLDSGPVQMDHVTKLNRGLRRALEDDGFPADDFAIDVESPGVRRELTTRRHYERFQGERARLKVSGGAEGEPPVTLIGELGRVGEDGITFAVEDGAQETLRWEEILHARLDPKY